MLSSLRKNAGRSVLVKVIFGAIVVVFVFWGIGTFGIDQMEWAARVNDRVISKKEFNLAYQNLAQVYREMAPEAGLSDLIRGQALDQLINTELLVQEGRRLGLRADEQELRESIAAIEAFQIDGRFNKNRYLELLRLQGLKPVDFETVQRRQLLANKVLGLVRAGVHVTEVEVEDSFHYENDRLTLRFIRIPAGDFADEVTLGEDELASYYQGVKESFREPERIRISYLEFRPEDFAAQVTPAEEDIRAYYEEHREEYRQPDAVRARHILFELPSGASEEKRAEARQRAAEVLELARGGGDFAALAVEHSEAADADTGGDLGTLEVGTMMPAFEEAAFSLAPGEVSDVVETDLGLQIIKVEEKLEDQIEELDEVRDKIVAELQKRGGRQLAIDRVEEAHEQLLDGEEIEAVSAEYGLVVQTPPAFARDESIVRLGRRPELSTETFATETGEVGEISSLDSGYVVFVVKERIDTHIPELEVVRGEVESQMRDKRAAEGARARGEQLLQKLREHRDIDALAEQEGLKVAETGEIGRLGGYIPDLGNAPDLKDAGFRLTAADPVADGVFDVGGDAVIALLGERRAADDERLEQEKEPLTRKIRQQSQAAAVRQFLDYLRNKAEVRIGQGYTGTS